MKVLKGAYKGVELAVPEGGTVRPTVDHLKKNIMNLITPFKVEVVWDLFAGSGGVGIELLSQRAKHGVFVDQYKKAMDCIKLNVAECRLKNKAAFAEQTWETVLSSAEDFLKGGGTSSPDLIFLDPPYDYSVAKMIPLIFTCPKVTHQTVVLIEHVKENFSEKGFENHILFQKIYGPKVLTALIKKI
jgi:16S rRNA (guanine966-N2)-methyltransferase